MEKNHQETETTTDTTNADKRNEENHQETKATTDTTNADKINDQSWRDCDCEGCLRYEVASPTPSLFGELYGYPRGETPPLPANSTGNQPLQQMLRLSNPSNVCYANAGTNLLFSSPLVTTFLSALPENNAELNIVKQLATLTPNSVGNLAELRKTVAENTQFKCNNDSIQEDTSEWIHALYETIWQLLDQNVNMQTNWCNLFNWNSTITFQCCADSDHKSEDITTNVILRLLLCDDDGRAITALNDSVDQLFNYSTIIHKNCEECGDNTRFKKNRKNYRNSRSISCTVYALQSLCW